MVGSVRFSVGRLSYPLSPNALRVYRRVENDLPGAAIQVAQIDFLSELLR